MAKKKKKRKKRNNIYPIWCMFEGGIKDIIHICICICQDDSVSGLHNRINYNTIS